MPSNQLDGQGRQRRKVINTFTYVSFLLISACILALLSFTILLFYIIWIPGTPPRSLRLLFPSLLLCVIILLASYFFTQRRTALSERVKSVDPFFHVSASFLYWLGGQLRKLGLIDRKPPNSFARLVAAAILRRKSAAIAALLLIAALSLPLDPSGGLAGCATLLAIWLILDIIAIKYRLWTGSYGSNEVEVLEGFRYALKMKSSGGRGGKVKSIFEASQARSAVVRFVWGVEPTVSP